MQKPGTSLEKILQRRFAQGYDDDEVESPEDDDEWTHTSSAKLEKLSIKTVEEFDKIAIKVVGKKNVISKDVSSIR